MNLLINFVWPCSWFMTGTKYQKIELKYDLFVLQKIKDKQLERKKCLARDLSNLIVYAVAVPFDLDRKFSMS